MMRKVSAVLIVIAALGLAGCGYRPMYASTAEDQGVAAVLSTIKIAEADTREGQIIRNDLISAMRPGNVGSGDRYLLALTPVRKKTSIVDKKQPSTTRDAVRLNVVFELIDQKNGQVVYSGKTFSQVSFDVVRQPFADTQAETDAMERAAHEVSGDIRTRLAAFFATRS
jgi:LPS-assembly lipoprotein